MSVILEARGLRKSFRSGDAAELEVLVDVNLAVHRGEVVTIVGESGAGKSTLLHLLGVLDEPTGGEIVLDGQVDIHQHLQLRSVAAAKILPEAASLEYYAHSCLIASTGASSAARRDGYRVATVATAMLAKMISMESNGCTLIGK